MLLHTLQTHTKLHLLLFFLRLLSLSSELDGSDSDSELADSESEESELPDSSSDSESETGFCCCIISRGIFFKYSRRFSVRPPSPMDVKKLMANLVFFGLSLGKMDSKESCIVESLSRSLRRRIPRCSDNSYSIDNNKVKSSATSQIDKFP